jgi:hypothetical protein
MLTMVNIELWVLLVGVALPSACLLMISLVYLGRRLSRRQNRDGSACGTGDAGFSQQVLLEMVLQQTDNALNRIVDAVQEQRTQMLRVLETHQLTLPNQPPAESAGDPDLTPADVDAQVSSTAAELVADGTPGDKATVTAPVPKARARGKVALFDPYRQIPDYVHQGLSVPEVAARLDLPESAVDLYIKLRMAVNKDGSQKTA